MRRQESQVCGSPESRSLCRATDGVPRKAVAPWAPRPSAQEDAAAEPRQLGRDPLPQGGTQGVKEVAPSSPPTPAHFAVITFRVFMAEMTCSFN